MKTLEQYDLSYRNSGMNGGRGEIPRETWIFIEWMFDEKIYNDEEFEYAIEKIAEQDPEYADTLLEGHDDLLDVVNRHNHRELERMTMFDEWEITKPKPRNNRNGRNKPRKS